MVLPFKPFKFLINLLWASLIQTRQAYVEHLKTVLDYYPGNARFITLASSHLARLGRLVPLTAWSQYTGLALGK
jgi:hypothetical protein